MLYGILACEAASLLSPLGGGNLVQENHFMFGICPRSSLDQKLYPRSRLPALALAGCLISISGSILRIWSQRSLGKFFTWEVSIRPEHRLYTGGPYSMIRHPSYTALVMTCGGQAMLLAARNTFIKECLGTQHALITWISLAFMSVWQTILVVTVINRTSTEDEVLTREFGKGWEDWAQRTYRIFPGIY